MVLEPEFFPLRTLRRRARAQLAIPTVAFTGKTVIITGATGSICSETARILIELGVDTLVFGVRNVAKGEEIAKTLTNGKEGLESPPKILVWFLDATSFESVGEFAEKASKLPRLDNVVIGQAVMNTSRKETVDGWEETLQVIHLSSALLTILLLPTLFASAGKFRNQVVLTNITSWSVSIVASHLKGLMKAADGTLLHSVDDSKLSEMSVQYGKCKLLYLCFLRELCQKLGGRMHDKQGSVIINSVDPGTAATRLSLVYMSTGMGRLLLKYIGRPVETCARPVVNACQPRQDSHGKLFVDNDLSPYPKYVTSVKGQRMQKQIWEETRAVLERISLDTKLSFEDIEAGKYPSPLASD